LKVVGTRGGNSTPVPLQILSRDASMPEVQVHVTLNFNHNMSTAAVFLDIEKAFDTTWHSGLPYKLPKLRFSSSLIKLISSFLSNRKFGVMVYGKMSTPRHIQAEVPDGFVLTPALYSLYINDTPQTPGVYLAVFADDTFMYTTLQRESCNGVSPHRSRGVSTRT